MRPHFKENEFQMADFKFQNIRNQSRSIELRNMLRGNVQIQKTSEASRLVFEISKYRKSQFQGSSEICHWLSEGCKDGRVHNQGNLKSQICNLESAMRRLKWFGERPDMRST